jgi:hypothetical protein
MVLVTYCKYSKRQKIPKRVLILEMVNSSMSVICFDCAWHPYEPTPSETPSRTRTINRSSRAERFVPSLPCFLSCPTSARGSSCREDRFGGFIRKISQSERPLSPLSSKEIDRLDGLMVDRRLRAIFSGDIYTSRVRNRDRVPFSVIVWSEYSIPPLSWCSHSLDRNRETRSQSRITKR